MYHSPQDNRPNAIFSTALGCACIIAVGMMTGIGVALSLWFIWGVTKYSN